MPTLQDTTKDFLRRKAQGEQSFVFGSIQQNAQSFLRQKANQLVPEKPTFFQGLKNFLTTPLWQPQTEAEKRMKAAGFGPPTRVILPGTEPPISPIDVIKEMPEATKKVFSAIGEFGKSIGQSIARSFLATGQFITKFAETPYKPEEYERPIDYIKELAGKTYTPTSEIEKKIFGTDQPVSIETVGKETLLIGGEEFAKKWGNYAIPLGFLVAGVDVTPIGWGKKEVGKSAQVAIKNIAKTKDVSKIAKVLKTIVKGSDDEIMFLAKSLRDVNKEADVLKVLRVTLEKMPKVAPTISKELQPLAQEARKYKSAEEWFQKVKAISDKVETTKVYGRARTIKELPANERIIAEAGLLPGEAVLRKDPTIKQRVLDFYTQAVKGVKEVIPPVKPSVIPKEVVTKTIKATEEVLPESKTAIQKLTDALSVAKPLRGKQEALYSAERARRTARVEAMGQKIAGEKGFFAQLGQLKGPLPKAQFEAIRKLFTQTEIDSLFNVIQKSDSLLPLEKVTTKGALAKLFEGAIPTKGEIELLREVFPKDFIEAILKNRPLSEKIMRYVGEVINVPRTMMASIDFSAPLRQGLFLIRRQKQFMPNFLRMFKYAFSERAYQGMIEGIKTRPTYKLMRQSNLALTEIGGALVKREEAFMGNIVEKVPGIGYLVRVSNRAYTGFLNKMRADVFDDLLRKADFLKIKKTDSLIKSTADYVNAATGRGNLPKVIEKTAPVLNATFFSPRLMASRINLLNPWFYVQLDPLIRKEALKDLLGFGATAGTILGLASLNDDMEIGADPRSADFGKIKVGNTRYDIFGGFQQYIRIAAQLITGEIVSSTTGRTMTAGEGFGLPTRFDIALRFFEHKTSPIASFVIGLLRGETTIGDEFDVPTQITNRFISFVVQDLYDIAQEKGIEHIWEGAPAIFGVGVQTYGKQELIFGKSKLGEPIAQIRPVPEMAEKIRETVLGQLPLGTSKGFSIEAYYDQINDLPKEEAAEIFDQIKKANPELAKKIVNVVKEREKGITPKDKDLKAKGVASGDRALAIQKQFEELKTDEEKANLWDDYVKKGIITKEVARQLRMLLNQ